jgi:hypothetical protein
MTDDPVPPEQPRTEPEIIPPGQTGRWSDQSSWQPARGPFGFGQARGTQRIYVARLGPFGFAVLMLVFALLAVAVILAVIGAFLIWIPVVALLVVVAAVYRFLRR